MKDKSQPYVGWKCLSPGIVPNNNSMLCIMSLFPVDSSILFNVLLNLTGNDHPFPKKSMFNSSFGLSVTGIAGPSGGTKEKPVGLVYIGLASDKSTIVKKFNFSKDRKINKIKTSQAALNILRKGLLNE